MKAKILCTLYLLLLCVVSSAQTAEAVPQASKANNNEFPVLGYIYIVLIILMTVGGFFYWRRARRKNQYRIKEKAVYHGVEEVHLTFLDEFKTEWSGSPWEGRPRRGGLMAGFSPLVFGYVGMLMVLLLAYLGMALKPAVNLGGAFALFLYFTWVCFRQNRNALKMARLLSRDTVKAKEIYKKAFRYWPNRFAMWMAPWLGIFYYKKFKKIIGSLPEYCCPTCGVPMEKDLAVRLSEAHGCETRVEALRFESFRCGNGHGFVITEKGEHFEAFSRCPHCHAYTLNHTHTETINKDSFWHNGLKREYYNCLHCGESFSECIEY